MYKCSISFLLCVANCFLLCCCSSPQSDESRAQFEKLIAQAAEPIDFNIAARDYLAYINPAPSAATAGTALGSGDVTAASSSRMTQNKLPVGDQALKLLASGAIVLDLLLRLSSAAFFWCLFPSVVSSRAVVRHSDAANGRFHRARCARIAVDTRDRRPSHPGKLGRQIVSKVPAIA